MNLVRMLQGAICQVTGRPIMFVENIWRLIRGGLFLPGGC